MTKYEFKRFQSLEEPALHVAEERAEYYNFRYNKYFSYCF